MALEWLVLASALAVVHADPFGHRVADDAKGILDVRKQVASSMNSFLEATNDRQRLRRERGEPARSVQDDYQQEARVINHFSGYFLAKYHISNSKEDDEIAKLMKEEKADKKKKNATSSESDAQMEEYDALLKSLFEKDDVKKKVSSIVVY